MQVQYTDGRREDQKSPFATDQDLEDGIKFLATFGVTAHSASMSSTRAWIST